MRTELGLVTP
jgi:hypothetical protein